MTQSETTSAAGGGEKPLPWSAFSIDEADSIPSDPCVGYSREWAVGYWTEYDPDPLHTIIIGSRDRDEHTARQVAKRLNAIWPETAPAALAAPTAKGGTEPTRRERALDEALREAVAMLEVDKEADEPGSDLYTWLRTTAPMALGLCEFPPPPAGAAGGGSGDLTSPAYWRRAQAEWLQRRDSEEDDDWIARLRRHFLNLSAITSKASGSDDLGALSAADLDTLDWVASELSGKGQTVAAAVVVKAARKASASTPDLGAWGEPVAWPVRTINGVEDLPAAEALVEKGMGALADSTRYAIEREAKGIVNVFAPDAQPALLQSITAALFRAEVRRVDAVRASREAPAAPRTGSGVSVGREAVREILGRLWCFGEGQAPDDTISGAGHTVLCATLGGFNPTITRRIEEHTDAILKLLALADRGETQAVGDGWQLVPVEPTPKMVAATWDDPTDAKGGIESQNTCNKRVYAAMLAAAPTPPSGVETIRQGGEQ